MRFFKKIILFLIVLILSVTLWFNYSGYFQKYTDAAISSPDKETAYVRINNDLKTLFSPQKNKNYAGDAKATLPRTTAEIAEVDDWFKRNGIGPSRESYASYSEDELEAMLLAGDFIAGDVLTSRYLDKMDLQQAKITAEKSLIYGSRRAAMNLYLIYHYDIPSSMDDVETRLRKKDQLVDMFSYLELADLRGGKDLFYTEADRRAALTSFKRAYGDDEILTEEDYLDIQNKALLLYEKYEKKRQELGFGEFDNELPKAVSDYLK